MKSMMIQRVHPLQEGDTHFVSRIVKTNIIYFRMKDGVFNVNFFNIVKRRYR